MSLAFGKMHSPPTPPHVPVNKYVFPVGAQMWSCFRKLGGCVYSWAILNVPWSAGRVFQVPTWVWRSSRSRNGVVGASKEQGDCRELLQVLMTP